MKRKIGLSLLFAGILLLTAACNQKNNDAEKENLSVSKLNDKTVYTVSEFFNIADSLAEDTVLVEGIVEHLCRHSDKRFKMISSDGKSEIRVETNENLSRPEPSDIGKKIVVKGKPVPLKFDLEAVDKWEQNTINNHVGEQDTEDYKKEIKAIREIKEKILSGQIPYYTNYSLEAFSYEFIGQ
jgi:hypothetical protein